MPWPIAPTNEFMGVWIPGCLDSWVSGFLDSTDRRKSCDGLTGLVPERLGQGPLTGHLFLFLFLQSFAKMVSIGSQYSSYVVSRVSLTQTKELTA